MKIKIIKCLQDNYSYVIIDENNQSACVVDPSESKPIIDFIDNNKIDLKYILNTHHHHDHIGGNLELKKKYNCDVIGFKDDRDRIPGIDVLVESNQIWQKDNFEAKIYHTPGHTSGHIAFHFFKEKIIFIFIYFQSKIFQVLRINFSKRYLIYLYLKYFYLLELKI